MVLMVDDDPDVRTSVARGLRHSGFDVRVAANGKEALRLLSSESHDALVLDVQMPELDGVAVVTALRALGNDIPICVLSARDTVNDRIAGLEAGADDYLTKPFRMRELVARVAALLRRVQRAEQLVREAAAAPRAEIVLGGLRVDVGARRTWLLEDELHLTPTEFDLLCTLASAPGQALTRERLLAEVWGWDGGAGATRTVDSHVKALRSKIGSERVRTVHGVGYALEGGRP